MWAFVVELQHGLAQSIVCLWLQCCWGKALKFLSVSTKQFKILKEEKKNKAKGQNMNHTVQLGNMKSLNNSILKVPHVYGCWRNSPIVCFTMMLKSLLLMTVCCKHWPLLDTCDMYTIVKNSPTMWKPLSCFLQKKTYCDVIRLWLRFDLV